MSLATRLKMLYSKMAVSNKTVNNNATNNLERLLVVELPKWVNKTKIKMRLNVLH
jgi:hypothetical protein